MLGYIVRRILATIPVVTVVAVFVFLLLRLTGGDPAAIIAGDSATTQQVAEIRVKLGLERPIVEQFGIWVGRSSAAISANRSFKAGRRADRDRNRAHGGALSPCIPARVAVAGARRRREPPCRADLTAR
jgi:hypothetical protein